MKRIVIGIFDNFFKICHEFQLLTENFRCSFKYGVLYENALEELKYRYCYAGLSEEEVEGKVAYCYSTNIFGSKRNEIIEMKNGSLSNRVYYN